ncbi:recombinase family protein [Arthrobacter monumenti]
MADTERPKLEDLISSAREGDTPIVHSMDRLARNLDGFRSLDPGGRAGRIR